jgi:hypothetical protein
MARLGAGCKMGAWEIASLGDQKGE